MDNYTSLDQVVFGSKLLHEPGQLRQLTFLHKDYVEGDPVWNKRNNAYPRYGYVHTPEEVAREVRQYDPAVWMRCIGVEPRAEPQFGNRLDRQGNQYLRATKQDEIKTRQNIFLDFDGDLNNRTKAQLEAEARFFEGAVFDYCHDLGVAPPVQALSRRGRHLYFRYEPIGVETVPDIQARTKRFARDFAQDHEDDLARLGLVMDTNTLTPNGIVVCHGTAKPETPDKPSQLLTTTVPPRDAALRDYLLSLTIPIYEALSAGRSTQTLPIAPLPELAARSHAMLDTDEQFRSAYFAQSTSQDSMRDRWLTDYKTGRRAVELGETDLVNLVTIIATRPDGMVRNGQGDLDYILGTIAECLKPKARRANGP